MLILSYPLARVPSVVLLPVSIMLFQPVSAAALRVLSLSQKCHACGDIDTKISPSAIRIDVPKQSFSVIARAHNRLPLLRFYLRSRFTSVTDQLLASLL